MKGVTMNRCGVCTVLVVIGIIIMGAVLLAAGARSVLAAGSPKQLRKLTDSEVAKIEGAAPAKADVTPAKPRKILVFWLCNGFFHECIPVANKAIETMGKKAGAFDVVFSDDMKMFDADKLAAFDAVLFNNTTRLEFKDPNQRKALMDFAKGGKGIIGIHAATDNFYDWPEAAEMMGGIFVAHPWTAGGTWAIKNYDPGHPLNRAFEGKGFKIRDEIYRVMPLKLKQNCRVLLTLDLDDPATRDANGVKESDRDMPVDWIRNFEKGRVFYCGLGHNNEIFWNAPIMQHYLDGVQFALGDLHVDATPARSEEKTGGEAQSGAAK